jgi:hypothetical protein
MKHLQQLVVVKILNGKSPIACTRRFDDLLVSILVLFFRNLFKGIEKIHFEIFDQVNIVFQIEILLIDENFF